ncbi:MAG: hypothetical protein EXS05_14195, partial [Planctomycetaceae bacterium]|nr:hypothetical protein [Planctomycetaceae bacterium]
MAFGVRFAIVRKFVGKSCRRNNLWHAVIHEMMGSGYCGCNLPVASTSFPRAPFFRSQVALQGLPHRRQRLRYANPRRVQRSPLIVGQNAFHDRAVIEHKRHQRRFAYMMGTKASRSADSIPYGSGSPVATKAAYDFLNNPRVEAKIIERTFSVSTATACCQESVVLVVHDTT